MRRVFLVSLGLSGVLGGQEGDKPFVLFPPETQAYLLRVQKGEQAFAFTRGTNHGTWRGEARAALVRTIGLERMRRDLGAFQPRVMAGERIEVGESHTRTLYTMETEPGVSIPFYLLVPRGAETGQRFPLLLCPHGHDRDGLHSYAGAYRDKSHREKILGREGNIAEQAVQRGYVAIAPATRGLADEVSVPDPRGRHGNRPCRAQLMHCLVAGRTPIGERVWDMQCLLDWAVKHPLVDPGRIVMTGNSGGGVVTAYTAALDERIRVAIPSCSFTSMTSSEGYIFHCDCCMVPGLRNWGGWKEIGGLVAPRHLLLVHGVGDGLHKRADVEAVAARVKTVFEAAGVPDNMALKWGPGGHRFYPDLMWPFVDAALAGQQ